MNITVTEPQREENTLTAEVTVAASDVNAAIKKTYKDIAQQYRFQGFRRGKAPRPVVDAMLGKEGVFAQATNDLLNSLEPAVLEEMDVTPVGRLSFGEEPELLVEGAEYKVNVKVDVRPQVELESYDAPEVNMPPRRPPTPRSTGRSTSFSLTRPPMRTPRTTARSPRATSST